MQTIKIDKAAAIKEYNDSSIEVRESLRKIFGDKFFMPVTERIQSYEDACADQGLDPIAELPYPNPINARQEYANAAVQLDIINTSLLEGAILDWTNRKQEKWGCYFNEYSSGSGFRFYDSVHDWTGTHAFGGARLALDTKEKTDYFGTKFLQIWNKFLNPNK